MSGRALQHQLKELRERHGVYPRDYIPALPLADPVDHDIVVEGYASTTDVDLERMSFAPFAFGQTLPSNLPLLFDHEQPAGTIDRLFYNHRGELMIRATVTHPPARRCGGFSIAARVRDYVIRDPDTRAFYAEVSRAELEHVAVVTCPVNQKALVTRRSRLSLTQSIAAGEFYELIAAKVQTLTKMVQLLKPEEARP